MTDMIRLKSVSKYYHSKGIISSGMLKINLSLNMGEFAVITGESGSGKSTLLNVISGLDSYEEGEMYIDGEDTSAYTEDDYEYYRKKYISNIFQSFNLVNSYSVYQNVQLAMLLTGSRANKEQRQKINEVLKRVGLWKYRRMKASRLSGGQKQRVAIARALVRDTPVIVADEPTGNLDSESAEAVVKLLREVAKDKLVIIVTHNYEQVEPYVTRKITMHDGRIIEDAFISHPEEETEEVTEEETEKVKLSSGDLGNLRFLQRIRLGIRNAFNIVPKFLLLLFIFLFTSVAVTGFYTTMRKSNYDQSVRGYNWYFNNTSDKRIILKRSDLQAFTDEDYTFLEGLDNTDTVIKEDILLDRYVSLESMMFYLYGTIHPMNELSSEPTYGNLPEDGRGIVIVMNSNYYMAKDEETVLTMLEEDFTLRNDNTGTAFSDDTVKITGIVIEDSDEYSWYVNMYAGDEILEEVQSGINSEYSTVKTTVNGNELIQETWGMMNRLVPSQKVEKGTLVVPEDWDYFFDRDWRARGKEATVTVSNLYYSKETTFKIAATYGKRDFTDKTGLTDYDWQNGVIMINDEDYASFFDAGNFQVSLFIKDPKLSAETLKTLEDHGYTPLYMKDALRTYDDAYTFVENILKVVGAAILMMVLFLIDYFIIRIIMRSRNTYFSTVRMLGGSKSDVRALLITDLTTVLNIAYILMAAGLYAVNTGMLTVRNAMVNDILTYLQIKDYIILYVILLVTSLLISRKYSRQLFKDTAMNTLREEA